MCWHGRPSDVLRQRENLTRTKETKESGELNTEQKTEQLTF